MENVCLLMTLCFLTESRSSAVILLVRMFVPLGDLAATKQSGVMFSEWTQLHSPPYLTLF